MLQPFDYDPAEKYTHKFMIQTLIVEGDQDDVVGVTIVCLPQIQDKCVNCGGQSGWCGKYRYVAMEVELCHKIYLFAELRQS